MHLNRCVAVGLQTCLQVTCDCPQNMTSLSCDIANCTASPTRQTEGGGGGGRATLPLLTSADSAPPSPSPSNYCCCCLFLTVKLLAFPPPPTPRLFWPSDTMHFFALKGLMLLSVLLSVMGPDRFEGR